MQRYLTKVRQLTVYFKSFEIQRISRSQNRRADTLSRLTSTSFSDLNKTVLVEVLNEPGYMEEVACPVHPGDTWMSPFILFLGQGILPEDRAKARKIQRKTARYALCDGEMYKRFYLGPWLGCVTPEAGRQILHEIHESLCGAHVGHNMLAKKTLLLGYFWPSIRQDAQDLVFGCPSCQVHASEHHQPSKFMVPITLPWPFEQWGTDIIGPFPKAVGGYTFLVTAVDYFTKWVEAEPLRTITGFAVQKFFWKCIVYRFGIPQVIISDNGRQLVENPFRIWCENLDYVAEVNEEKRQLDLDLVDERRDIASARVASYKNTLAQYYNARVKQRRFQPGDLVLRKNSVSRAEPQGKLCPKWEGPYRIVESNLSRYCKLSYRDGSLVPRTWHAETLKLYYV
ncbi:uncharacterized protein [Coffea arabica]|uniref:Integrase catalytic domain-containing protein n=1 Tax=Coffea arabica TaxID=13443 RepID=A0ABM4VM32_COFAR